MNSIWQNNQIYPICKYLIHSIGFNYCRKCYQLKLTTDPELWWDAILMDADCYLTLQGKDHFVCYFAINSTKLKSPCNINVLPSLLHSLSNPQLLNKICGNQN